MSPVPGYPLISPENLFSLAASNYFRNNFALTSDQIREIVNLIRLYHDFTTNKLSPDMSPAPDTANP